MALKISPSSVLDNMVVGEEIAYDLYVVNELYGNTVDSHTYKIYDSSDTDVTSTFGGGSSELSGIITFGLKAIISGKYTLQFIITCAEMLPDSVTKYEFYVTLSVTIV